VLSPQQRLLVLDTWRRSGLPARDFSAIVGVSRHTLYAWKRRFKERGPAGLLDEPRGAPRGSRLSELTKRTILMLKEEHPEWGCQRISDMLLRGPALAASPGAVARVLHEAGYELEESPTRPHRDHVRRFERERANQLWQSDLFTFVLKRQNRRVYLVVFLDDHSRFVTGWGLRGSQSSELVLETLRAAILSYRTPREILTDNGSQYVTWRGKSAFSKDLERRGIKHIVATPRRPQTLGKVERFWGSLWRECLETAIFLDLEDARRRIGHFIDHYNFQRPHQGIGGLVPADRYFGAAPEVLRTLKERVAANALDLAREGLPRKPFYLTGQVAGEGFSVHAEGERVILKRGDGEREEVELVSPKPQSDELPESISESTSAPLAEAEKHEAEPPAGTSLIDEFLALGRRAPQEHQERRESDELDDFDDFDALEEGEEGEEGGDA
jgi:transposase InsO family protein